MTTSFPVQTFHDKLLPIDQSPCPRNPKITAELSIQSWTTYFDIRISVFLNLAYLVSRNNITWESTHKYKKIVHATIANDDWWNTFLFSFSVSSTLAIFTSSLDLLNNESTKIIVSNQNMKKLPHENQSSSIF